jgi:hypothetical protein
MFLSFLVKSICQHLSAGGSKYIVFRGPFSCLFWGMCGAYAPHQNKQCMHFTGSCFTYLILLSLKPS